MIGGICIIASSERVQGGFLKFTHYSIQTMETIILSTSFLLTLPGEKMGFTEWMKGKIIYPDYIIRNAT